MEPELNYTYEEKLKIITWKDSLPISDIREYTYSFIETGKRNNDGYKLYKFVITSSDGHELIVSKKVSL